MSSMELGRPIRRVPRKREREQIAASPARVHARELESMPPDVQCYFLYCRGYSSPQIAVMLGLDRNTVMRRVKKVVATIQPSDEDKASWAQQSVDSFQQVKAAAWTHFEQTSDPYLLAQITAAEERIARVRGLIDTQKVKHEHSGPNGNPIGVRFIDAATVLARITAGSEEDS